MKSKVFLFIFILLIVALLILKTTTTLTNALYIENDYVESCVYSNINLDEYNHTKCGELYIIKNNNLKIEFNSSSFLGEFLFYENNDFKDIINKNNLKIISYEKFDGFYVLNCYSWRLPKYIYSNNKRINLQFAIYENSFKLGYPLILDGF